MGTVEAREKARSRPIEGPYRDFALEVRRLLGFNGDRPFLTSRQASRKTGVNYSTVAAMARGERGSEYSITQFATKMGGSPKQLLDLAGYIQDESDPERVVPSNNIEGATGLKYTVDQQALSMVAEGFAGLPVSRQREIAERIKNGEPFDEEDPLAREYLDIQSEGSIGRRTKD